MKKLIWAILFLILISGCAPLTETKESQILMGTTAEIIVIDEDTPKANESIAAAFEEIKRIEDIMTIYNNESQVGVLNKEGILENVEPELAYLINMSGYYSGLSDGAFDITVQPILDLYTESFNELKRAPTDEEIKETSTLIGYKGIIINGSTIKLNKKGMKITLGGIAKGYAIDRAIEVLEKKGIKHALVNLGGNMRAIGSKIDEPWKIALENPRNKGDYITIIDLSDKSVSTSGDYERYFNENKSFHHIINPKTGYSATDLISVTIITDKALDADALSTTVFVLGPEKGLELIESLDGVEGLLITKDRKIIKSKGFNY